MTTRRARPRRQCEAQKNVVRRAGGRPRVLVDAHTQSVNADAETWLYLAAQSPREIISEGLRIVVARDRNRRVLK